MAGFLKVLFRNLLDGPSTDPFPFGDTFSPKTIRGKCVVDPDLCMGCGICRDVCVANAIDITAKADGSGHTITIWRNSCCLCGSCVQYCPTGAMTINDDWHSAHLEEDKYNLLEQKKIEYVPCRHCGQFIKPLPAKLAEKLYAKNDEINAEDIRHICPQCRQIEDAKRNENKPLDAPDAKFQIDQKPPAGETIELKANGARPR